MTVTQKREWDLAKTSGAIHHFKEFQRDKCKKSAVDHTKHNNNVSNQPNAQEPQLLWKKERKEVTLIIKPSKLKHVVIPKEDKHQRNSERILVVMPFTEKSLPVFLKHHPVNLSA